MLVGEAGCESLVRDKLTEGGFSMADCDAGKGRVSSGIVMNTVRIGFHKKRSKLSTFGFISNNWLSYGGRCLTNLMIFFVKNSGFFFF